MGTSKTRDFPIELEGVRQRWEDWRRTRRTRSWIPESLWATAVRAAAVYGICRTAKALRVDYYALKKRLEQESAGGADRSGENAAATFLELTSPTDHGLAAVPVGRCECVVELEDADGAKMRIHLKGAQAPDLAALSRSFWNPAP